MAIPTNVKAWLFRGAFYTLAGRIIFGLTTILINVLCARLLSQDGLGAFLLMQSLILPATLVAVFGTDMLSIRTLAESESVIEIIQTFSIIVGMGALGCAIAEVG